MAWDSLYHWRLMVARKLAAIRLHRWQPGENQIPEWVCKRRTVWGDGLIGPGNVYLALQGACARALHRGDWIARELAMAKVLGRPLRMTEDGRGIEFPRLPGDTLHKVLASAISLGQKLYGLRLASAALYRLHAADFAAAEDLTCDSRGPFSHGDATAHNVIVNLEAETANWIDFDIEHLPQLTAERRQADDLRTLLWSAAVEFDAADYAACLDAIRTSYPDSSRIKLMQHMTLTVRCPSVFELSQSPLTPGQLRRLGEVLSTLHTG